MADPRSGYTDNPFYAPQMKEFPQRRPNRLKQFDYSANRIYFVTVCTKNREACLGHITDGKMCLSIIGKIVKKCWTNIPDHFTDIELMDFFIMPDHLHGILNIQRPNENNVIGHDENIGDRHDLGLWNSHGRDIRNSHGEDIRNRHACSLQLRTTRYHQKLPVIIGSFKSSVTRLIRKSDYGRYFAWQKSYYDRIIRNDNELKTLRNYIKTNPRTWTLDEHSNNP